MTIDDERFELGGQKVVAVRPRPRYSVTGLAPPLLLTQAAASVKDGKRIVFRFDRVAFSVKFLPFKVPCPVPFRLLGEEAKGWLDTTYLSNSGNLPISRGNKGTAFVLQKKAEPRQRLLTAISTGTKVREVETGTTGFPRQRIHQQKASLSILLCFSG